MIDVCLQNHGMLVNSRLLDRRLDCRTIELRGRRATRRLLRRLAACKDTRSRRVDAALQPSVSA